MSKTGNQTATLTRKELFKQQAALWQRVPAEWVSFLETIGAENITATGSRIKICCPFHPDTNPSGLINLSAGYFKCWAGSCGIYVRDPIRLAQQILSVSYTEAFNHYRKHFNVTQQISKDLIKGLDDAEENRKRLLVLTEVFHEYLCNIWQVEAIPETAKKARKWLKEARGIKDVSALTSLGLLPRPQDLERLYKSRGMTDDDFKWVKTLIGSLFNFNYMDAVVYTYATAPGHVSAFKFRLPEADKESIRTVLVEEDSPLGAFGLLHSAYAPLIANDKLDSVIAVEGEHDQLTAFQGQLQKAIFDEVFIGFGGNGNQGIDFLADLGIKTVSLVCDDDEGGRELPVHILKKTRKVTCRIFNWPSNLRNPVGGKFDPDESIRCHGFDTFYQAAINPANYTHAPRWAYDKAKSKLKSVDPDNVVEQESVAKEIGAILRNDIELRSFAELFSKDYPLITPVNVTRAVAKSEDSALGFMHRIVDWIKNYFHIVSVDNIENVLKLWDKKERRHIHVYIGTNRGITTFKAYIPSGNLYEWVRDEIGLPPYFPDVEGDDASQAALDKAELLIERTLQRAFSVIAHGAIENPWALKGQGVHLADITEGLPGYIVNGTRIFKMEWHESGDQLKNVVELDGPSDNKVVFDLDQKLAVCSDMSQGWLPFLKEDKDILQAPKYSLRQCYDLLVDIYDATCEFRYQAVDVKYCALLTLYSYVSDVIFFKKVLTHFMGEYNSGKSSLLSLLCNHKQLSEFSLTYHAVSIDNYTVAGVFQSFSGTRHMVGLDEANDEQDGSSRSLTVSTLLERFRGLNTAGSTSHTQGTTDRKGAVLHIQNPITTASATLIADSMNDSRFNTLFLVKNSRKKNTRILLREKYGLELFADLRKSIFLNCIRYSPKIGRTYLDMYSRLGLESKNKKENINVSRFVENLMPLAAIAEVVNGSGIDFMHEYHASREQVILEQSHSAPGYEIIDSILNAPYMEVPVDDRPYNRSVRSLLQSGELRGYINVADRGIYFDEPTQCIGIAWSQVKFSLFNGALSHLRAQSPKSIQARVEACADLCIKESEAQKLGIIDRLKSVGMAGASRYTIVRVGHIITDSVQAQARLASTNKSTSGEPTRALAKSENPLDEVDF